MTRAGSPRCESCRVPLPRDAARCPSCGHEAGAPLIGIGSRDAGVTVGSAPRGRRQVAFAAGVIVALIAVLAVVDRGSADRADQPATTTTTSTTTTSTTRPAVTTPATRAATTTSSTLPPLVLGERTGVKLLVLTGRRSVLVDLDTGTSADDPPKLSGFVLARAGGVILQDQGPGASFLAAPYDGALVSVSAIPTGEVLASAAEDRVWLVGPSGPPLGVAEVATSGEIVQTFALPGDGYPSGAVEGGLVVSAHGSIYVVRGRDDITSLGAGEVVATSPRTIAALACDASATCSLTFIDARTGRRRAVNRAGVYGGQGVFSPDGRWLTYVSQQPNRQATAQIVDVVNGTVRDLSTESAGFSGAVPAFSPDSRWMFSPNRGGVEAVRVEDGAVVDIPLGLPAGEVNQVVVLP